MSKEKDKEKDKQPKKFEFRLWTEESGREYCKQAQFITSQLGATSKQLAKAMGIHLSTVNRWMEEHPEFREAVKGGKDYYDTQIIEKSLKRAASGYEVVEVERNLMRVNEAGEPDRKGEKYAMVVVKETTRHIPPNPTSMIFWLKNRDRLRWRDKQEVEHTGQTVNIMMNLTGKQDD